jgi:hypothetical protein
MNSAWCRAFPRCSPSSPRVMRNSYLGAHWVRRDRCEAHTASRAAPTCTNAHRFLQHIWLLAIEPSRRRILSRRCQPSMGLWETCSPGDFHLTQGQSKQFRCANSGHFAAPRSFEVDSIRRRRKRDDAILSKRLVRKLGRGGATTETILVERPSAVTE